MLWNILSLRAKKQIADKIDLPANHSASRHGYVRGYGYFIRILAPVGRFMPLCAAGICYKSQQPSSSAAVEHLDTHRVAAGPPRPSSEADRGALAPASETHLLRKVQRRRYYSRVVNYPCWTSTHWTHLDTRTAAVPLRPRGRPPCCRVPRRRSPVPGSEVCPAKHGGRADEAFRQLAALSLAFDYCAEARRGERARERRTAASGGVGVGAGHRTGRLRRVPAALPHPRNG